jgi:hypothetical protein
LARVKIIVVSIDIVVAVNIAGVDVGSRRPPLQRSVSVIGAFSARGLVEIGALDTVRMAEVTYMASSASHVTHSPSIRRLISLRSV